MSKKEITSGKKVNHEDDLVVVYDDKGNVDYQGILDCCPYKYDAMWNEADGNYDLSNGYKMVGL